MNRCGVTTPIQKTPVKPTGVFLCAVRGAIQPSAIQRGAIQRGAMFAVAGFLMAALLPTGAVQAQEEQTPLQTVLAMEQVLVDAIATAEKSVVAIARVRKGRVNTPPGQEPGALDPEFVPNEFGAGVAIDRKGNILTNYHVLRDPERYDYFVYWQKKAYKAKLVGSHSWYDLAVLRIEGANIEPIKFGDTTKLKKGRFVISLGNAYGIAHDGEPTASWGIVSGLARRPRARAPWYTNSSNAEQAPGKESVHYYGTLIYCDNRVNLGSSGGALINLRGEMIGLTTSLAALAGYEKSGGFAVPLDTFTQRVIRDLTAGRITGNGFLGIGTANLTAEQRRAGQLGVWVKHVVAGSPASKAGLQANGDIITHVNGKAVTSSDALIRDLSRIPPGDIVRLSVKRNSRDIIISAALSKKHLNLSRPSIATAPEPQWRGMQVDFTTAVPYPVIEQHGERIDKKDCVVVSHVDRGSPAWDAGLRQWMFISKVDGVTISRPREFYEQVEHKTGDVTIRETGDIPDGLHTVRPPAAPRKPAPMLPAGSQKPPRSPQG